MLEFGGPFGKLEIAINLGDPQRGHTHSPLELWKAPARSYND